MSKSAEMHGEHHADRASLYAARDRYMARLHRRSDDFEATRGLADVIAEIGRLPEQRPTITRGS